MLPASPGRRTSRALLRRPRAAALRAIIDGPDGAHAGPLVGAMGIAIVQAAAHSWRGWLPWYEAGGLGVVCGALAFVAVRFLPGFMLIFAVLGVIGAATKGDPASAAIFGLLALGAWWRWSREAQRRYLESIFAFADVECPVCKYSRSGATSDVCAECGTNIPELLRQTRENAAAAAAAEMPPASLYLKRLTPPASPPSAPREDPARASSPPPAPDRASSAG